MRAVFLDRDGTIVESGIYDKLSEGLMKQSDIKLIDGSAEAIAKLNENFIVVMITNQPSVAKEFCTEEDVKKTNQYILELLAEKGAKIDSVYYCPHHPDTSHVMNKYRIECDCRKPKTGMLKMAAADHKLDLKKCWVVGDHTMDISAGKNAGCKTILVKTGYGGKDGKYNVDPDYIADDLLQASNIIKSKTTDKQTPKASITQALILAGGKGERLRPLTDNTPKPMLPIAGKPLLEWQLLALKKHGIKNVIICASYLSDKIKGYFGSEWNDMKILYPEEKEPLGTGGAIKNSEHLLDDNFLVINGDVVNLVDFTSLIDFHLSKKSLATVVVRHSDHPNDSDIVDADENGRIISFLGRGQQEKNLGIAGLFVINKELVKKIPDGFSTLEKDVIVNNLNDKIFAHISNDYIKDMGTFERYEKVKKDFPSKLEEVGFV